MHKSAASRHDQRVSAAAPVRRATRPVKGRVVAGVCASLADQLRVPVAIVRIVFAVLAFASGIGVVLYAALWAVLPLAPVADGEDPSAARMSDTTRLLALASIAVGIALLLVALGAHIHGAILVPLLVAVFGAALVWRQTDEERRDDWSSAAGRAARRTVGSAAATGHWRIAIGAGLVFVGIAAPIVSHTSVANAAQGLAIALLILVGIGVVAFPWGYRKWHDQQTERRALIRSQERAEVAAHVHDSVLQTLTLIQRNAGDAREVARLARAEERALRGWLYTPTGNPADTLAAALVQATAEVEDSYDATIDTVMVGDRPLDERTSALLAATREALVNAARHGGGVASVYAECTTNAVDVYVRDRGAGFDLETIPADRHGVRESMIGRMERHGGTVDIKSSAGAGTEVHLRLLLTPEGDR